MAARPTVSVYSSEADKVVSTVPLPAVFTAPIRNDIVQFVHTNMAKNSRQAYGISRLSGHKYAAESWGTGRAVSRIPRVGGGGTNKTSTGAFGNMCRGGRMFAPNKVWRKWHRKINLHQKRFAVVSAIAATSVPALVMGRGHKIENIAEIPFVVEDNVQLYEKTKQAASFLKTVKAADDLDRVNDSRQLRAGRGKMRNRRYIHRRGPMLVLPDNKGTRAFRNIFGLDIANVNALNLLHLAPGGHIGRFVIWTKAAFEQLDRIFGTFTQASQVKTGFYLPIPQITNSDVTRIINSEEVRRAMKPKKLAPKKPSRYTTPSNGMKNRRLRLRLNPFEVKRSIAAKDMRNPVQVRVRRANKAKRVSAAKKGVKKMLKHNAAERKGKGKATGKK
jgi:large subunit ribosomal protein L4e